MVENHFVAFSKYMNFKNMNAPSKWISQNCAERLGVGVSDL